MPRTPMDQCPVRLLRPGEERRDGELRSPRGARVLQDGRGGAVVDARGL
jgi:hypothetical protein